MSTFTTTPTSTSTSNENENEIYFEKCKVLKLTNKIPSNFTLDLLNLSSSFYKIKFIHMVLKREEKYGKEIIRNIGIISRLFHLNDRDIRKRAFQIIVHLISTVSVGEHEKELIRKDILIYTSQFLSLGDFTPWFKSQLKISEFMLDPEVFRDIQTLKLATKLVLKLGYPLDIVPGLHTPQYIIDLYSDHDSELIQILGILLDRSSSIKSIGSLNTHSYTIDSKELNIFNPFIMFIKFMELIGFDESVIVDLILADRDDGISLTIDYLSRILMSIGKDVDGFKKVAYSSTTGSVVDSAVDDDIHIDIKNDGDIDSMDDIDDNLTDYYESVRLTMLEVFKLLSKASIISIKDPFFDILQSLP